MTARLLALLALIILLHGCAEEPDANAGSRWPLTSATCVEPR
ncbi:MAG: hypothetical protein AAGF92_21055 [Myxococcota bacterium]